MNFAYTYDNRGNITGETRNGVTTTYEYDALGQLTRVNDPNDPTGSAFGTTWIYTYDRGGNILNKSAYVYTTGTVGTVIRSWAYGYDDPNWKDKLTSFDGHTITYDAIGNPLNDGEWTYEWQAGRQLKRMTNLTTGVVMEFTYNHAGIRTKKVKKENGVAVETTEYILNGKQVVGLVHTDHTTNTTDELQFFYDAQGRVSMLKYGGALYSYVHNLQGDIVGIMDDDGEIVTEYRYDTWGNMLTIVGGLLGIINPFRYRGYVFDKEISMIYSIERYYNFRIQRFLTPDKIDKINGNIMNCCLFSYCENNACNRIDVGGGISEDQKRAFVNGSLESTCISFCDANVVEFYDSRFKLTDLSSSENSKTEKVIASVAKKFRRFEVTYLLCNIGTMGLDDNAGVIGWTENGMAVLDVFLNSIIDCTLEIELYETMSSELLAHCTVQFTTHSTNRDGYIAYNTTNSSEKISIMEKTGENEYLVKAKSRKKMDYIYDAEWITSMISETFFLPSRLW